MRREVGIAFQTDKTPGAYEDLAKLVNRYDFDVLSVYCDAPYHPSYGPLLLMAPHVERARIGPAAVSPFRIAPIDIAAETALLAQVARAGVYLGLARGAWLDEHGVSAAEHPIQALRETVEIVRYLLTGQTGGYRGNVYQLAEHVTAPYPLPEKPIPIMIGTWGPKMCALAGEVADEVKVGGSANPDVVPVIRGYIGVGEDRAGRLHGTVGVVMGAVTVVDSDREQARSAARRAVARYLPVVAPLDPTLNVDPELMKRLRRHAEHSEYEEASGLISDAMIDRFAFSGTAGDIIEAAEALFEAGASRVEFGAPHGLSSDEGIRVLGEQVVPVLRRA